MPLHFCGSTSTISRFGDRFRGGQYSLVSFLFAVLLLAVPLGAQPFVPRVQWSLCHCVRIILYYYYYDYYNYDCHI